MTLPTFEMIIDQIEDSEVEVSYMSLVDNPAIKRDFLKFNDKVCLQFNEEKRIISGVAMVSDMLIYRRDENGEYNVFFSKETIEDIALKFFKKGYNKNVNLFHNLKIEDVTIFESFISDKSRGIKPMEGFEDLPDGSWFISAKVENEEAWNMVKNGEVKGFSVEGIFKFKRPNLTDDEKMEAIKNILNGTK